MPTSKLFLPSFLALVALCASGFADGIPLRFHGRGGAEGLSWPVTFGVPFPEGALADGGRVQLVGPDGADVPAQVRTTGTWFDGSVRWTLLDAQLPVPEGVAEYRLKCGGEARPVRPREKRVAWRETTDSLVVDTGPLLAQICRASLRGLLQVGLRDPQGGWNELFPEGQAMDLYLERADGRAFRGSRDDAPKVAVEEQGPERVSVKVEGWLRDEEGEGLGRRVLRFYFHAGQRTVRMFDTFVKTADSEEVQYRNISLHLPFLGRSYRFAGAGMDASREVGAGDYLLQHKHNEFVRVADGERAYTGERALGSVTVSEGESAYTVTRRHFREMFPSEFEVGEGRLKLHFWPRHGREPEHLGEHMTVKNVGNLWWVHEGENLNFTVPEEVRQFQGYRRDDDLENVVANAFSSAPHWRRPPQDRFISNGFGTARTAEYWLDFHGEGDGAAGRDTFRADPRVVVDPEWLAASGAFWNIAPRSEHYAEVEDALERTLEFLPAMYERIGDYGLWNYGAYHQDYHPTLEYAHIHRHWKGFHHGAPRWPWLAFARSGKPEHFDFAWIHANHLLDVCVVNWECDEFNEQAAEVHRIRSLKFRGAHRRYKGLVHWWEGFARNYNSIADFALWTYYMTGYQRAWDVVMDMGEYLIAPYGHWPDHRYRQNRNGMSRGSAALSLYRATHDERFLEAAKDHMQYYRDVVDGTIEGGRVDPLRKIYYAPFLERYWQLVGDESLEPYIVRWAQYRADLGPWSERWPGSPWTGRDPFYNLMALGYHLTGDADFLRRGLHEARVLLDNRGANADPDLEGVLIHYYGGNPGYTAQQWGDFVKALDVHYERTGERLELPKTPDSLLHSFRFRAFRGHRDADGNRFRRLVFHTRKAEGEGISIRFPFRTQNPVEAEARGPDGVVKREALVPERGQCEFALELSAEKPAGDYRIEFFCGELVGRGDLVTSWPLPGDYRKLVVEMPFDTTFREAGRFYFLPRHRENGQARLRLRTAPHFSDRYYDTHSVYRPDGEKAVAATGQGHVNAPLDVPFEAEAADEGGLWLYSGSSLGFGGGAWVEGDVHKAVSFAPQEFFVPQYEGDP